MPTFQLFCCVYHSDSYSIVVIIITICHELLPPSRRDSLVKSDYACTIVQHTPLSPYTRHPCLDSVVAHIFTVYSQPHHVTASNPSLGDKSPERERVVQKNTRTEQNWSCRTQSSTHARGLSTPSYIITAQPPQSFLCRTI